MTVDPAADGSEVLPLSDVCERFYDFPSPLQQYLLTALFNFFHSDWDERGVPNHEILTALARIVAHGSFSRCAIDLNSGYERLLFIIETDAFSAMVPAALAILSAMTKRSSALRADAQFQSAVEKVVRERPGFNYLSLCKALIFSPPFPSSALLYRLHQYVDPILHNVGDLCFAGAIQFATAALRNGIPFEFSDFSSQVLDGLTTGDATVMAAVLEYLCAAEYCTEQICDVLLDRLSGSEVAATVAVRTGQLFLIAQGSLVSRSGRIADFLLGLVRQSDYAVRVAALLCLLVFLGDADFSVELCELLLEFYDLPAATSIIFQIFLRWIRTSNDADLAAFLEIARERKEEIADFLDSSDLPEHVYFGCYLPLLESEHI
jgi:hypothetical protein